MSKLTINEMLSMRAAGKTSREIAEVAGISHTAVIKRLRRADKAAKGPQDADSFKKEIEDNIDISTLTNAQKISLYRTANKSRKRVQPKSVEELRAQFRPIDLSIYETIPCDKCGLPQACKASPTCRLCRPDELFTSDEVVKVGEFTSIQQVKCRTEACRNQATLPMPKYGEAFGRDGLCNSCRNLAKEESINEAEP